MKVYHYARIEQWQDIRRGSWQSGGVPGLSASRRMGQVDPEAVEIGAAFFLNEPQPKSWVDNKEFPEAWQVLTTSIGELLLEVDIDGLESDTKVVDWAYMEAYFTDDITGRFGSSSRREAERKYLQSGVPLEDYVSHPNT